MSLPSSNWFSHWAVRVFANAPQSDKIQTRRRRTRRPAQQISLESLESRQMLSVNPASSGSSASSANDNSNIAAFVSQNSIVILAVVPSRPTSVVAVRGNTQLAVTWTAPASTGGSAITDYAVKYSSNSGSTWTNFIHPVSTVPSLTVKGLTNGTAYVIKVIAKNTVGISPPSANSAPATPLAAALTPTFGATTSTADGFIVQISNYDASYTWAGTATAPGISISGSGLVTVTGVAAATSSMATITTTKANAVWDSAPVTATSLATALAPTFGATTSTATGFIVQITNYNASYTWAGTATASGSVAVSGSGLVTVTGVATLTSSTATITTTRTGCIAGVARVTATSLAPALAPTFGSTTSTATGFTVQISNYNASYTWAGTATASGSVAVSGSGLVTVTGVAAGMSSTATITTTRAGYAVGSAPVTATSLLGTALTPTFGATTPTAGGFTVQISNYNTSYTWAGTATASGSVAISVSGLVKVTGVASLTNSTATITTTRAGYAGGSASVTATSLVGTALTPTFGAPTATATGFTVQISNYNAIYTWAGTATASGSVAVSGSGLVTVTGVATGTNSTLTITTTRAGYAVGSARVTAASLAAALTVNMSMVTVGNAGNAADTRNGSVYGAVSYSYQIGKYDVTGSQYTAFLNAVGSTDTYTLYNTNMGTDTRVAQISRSGTSGTYTYAVLNSTGDRPISFVSWFDSARFSNWMSNGQPIGAQNSTTTENGAYNVNGATYGNAVVKNATNPNTGLAPTYRIPLENEWYKAAYYSPNYGSTWVGGYYAFATQSDTAPGTTIGSSANQANYNTVIGHATDVGSFSASGSFYGTFDQSGNVMQWNDLDDGVASGLRGFRGGDWNSSSNSVSSSYRRDYDLSIEDGRNGFRLASPANTTLTPTFGAPTATATGFTVQISNYNASYTWAGTATASGTVVVSGTGLVTVTGVAAGTSSTATITMTRTGYAVGSAPVTATSLAAAIAVNMTMVTVGNPGNAADTNTGSLYGAVSYSYQIGKYDVTGSQYTAFLNAVGSTDTYALYDASMGTDPYGYGVAQISRSVGIAGTYTYAVLNSTGQRPITYVSWFDCARFSNWMSNGRPSGAQTSTTTENGAYNVNGATSGNAVAANATNPNTGLVPTYRIPLENEWYKAAYYSPNRGGTGVGGYYAYATQSSSAPGTTIGSSPNQANYSSAIGHATDVGSFSGSASFYGTFDQSGNVDQWNDLAGGPDSSRGVRGGNWDNVNSYYVPSWGRTYGVPAYEYYIISFRLASPV